MWPSLQVIEHKSTDQELGEILQELEAILKLQLDHPNVVHSYKYTNRQMNAVRSLMLPASFLLRGKAQNGGVWEILLDIKCTTFWRACINRTR